MLGPGSPRLPEIADFAAEILGGEHVKRAERLVHEENLGLDHKRAREADPLLHAAGQFLGIGGLESVEPDQVDRRPAPACAARPPGTPRAFRPSSTFSCTVSHGSSAKL